MTNYEIITNNKSTENKNVMLNHFSRIAQKYRDLRITNIEPILTIKSYLREKNDFLILDIGSGTGRYDELLLENFGEKIFLTCVDQNLMMLNELSEKLFAKNFTNFRTFLANCERLPFDDREFDVVTSFNAIHHFDLKKALQEMVRVVKENGFIFLYTRTPIQNENSIWGNYFPDFKIKENRLISVNDFERVCKEIQETNLDSIKYYYYNRNLTLSDLINQVQMHHYSTFSLYKEDELIKNLTKFKALISMNYPSLDNITWEDGNILVIMKKK